MCLYVSVVVTIVNKQPCGKPGLKSADGFSSMIFSYSFYSSSFSLGTVPCCFHFLDECEGKK